MRLSDYGWFFQPVRIEQGRRIPFAHRKFSNYYDVMRFLVQSDFSEVEVTYNGFCLALAWVQRSCEEAIVYISKFSYKNGLMGVQELPDFTGVNHLSYFCPDVSIAAPEFIIMSMSKPVGSDINEINRL